MSLLKKMLSAVTIICAGAFMASAQSGSAVKGKVVDSTGEPVVGAVVILQDAQNVATMTDVDGNYVLSLPAGITAKTLEYSCMGFQTAVEQIAGRGQINVTLADDNHLLDEVVVVGYGTQKKVDLTGAVASIDFGKKAEGRTIVSTSAALAGLAPGLSVMQSSGQPGSESTTIRVRGLGSFTSGSLGPLVLVDGVEWNMDNVNPNDIESISVLKDAASTAIYGTRAANGVILITTKTGDEQKPRITYSYKGILQNPYNELHFVSDYATHMELMNESCDNLGVARQFTQTSIDTWKAAKADPNGLNEYGVPNYVAYPNTDWFSEIFETGFSQEHNLSVSGGSKKVKYLTSIGYLDNQGVMHRYDIDSSTQKLNFRTNLEADVTKWFTMGVRLFGQRQSYGLANISNAFSYLYQTTPGVYPGSPNAWGKPALAAEESSNANNIFHQMYGSYGYNNILRLNTTAYIKIRPFKGMSVEASYNYAPTMQEKHTYSTGMNGFWDYVKDERYPGSEPKLSTATATNTSSTTRSTTMEILARYNTKFGEHEITALAGYSASDYYSWGWNLQREGATDWSLNELSTYETLKSGNGTARSGRAIQSGFGRINYSFMDRYLLEANVRMDQSSKFGSDYRTGIFPSASFGWKMDEEDFMASTKNWLDKFKIRFSVGQAGTNNGIGNYDSQATYAVGSVVVDATATKGLYMQSMSNDKLHWETSTTYNLGFDAALFGSRLTADFDVYNRISSDLLYTPTPYLTMGLMSGVPENFGTLSNKGLELQLNWKDSIGKDFSYYVGGNVSFNKNKVVAFKGELIKGMVDGKYVNNLADVAEGYGTNGYICEGYSMGEHYLLKLYHGTGEGYTGGGVDPNAGPKDGMIRTETDMKWVQAMMLSGYSFCGNTSVRKDQLWYGDLIYADSDGDKNYGDSDDRDFNGRSATPSCLVGLNLGCSWKGIDLSMTWSGAFGFWIYYATQYYNACQLTNGYAIPESIANNHYFYDKSNPNDARTNLTATYPRLTYGQALSNREASEFYEYKGDYFKLKNIQIGYTLPAKFTSKLAMQQLRFFASGENLLTFTSFPGLDPEKGATISYPLMKQFTFGAQVTF